MVCKVNIRGQLNRVLSYHQAKLEQGKARLLGSGNFLREPKALGPAGVRDYFRFWSGPGQPARIPVIHISMNLPPAADPSDSRMLSLGRRFLALMGWDQYPWLLYRHLDTGHPHTHIVLARQAFRKGLVLPARGWQRRVTIVRSQLEAQCPWLRAGIPAGAEHSLRRADPDQGPLVQRLSETLETLINRYRFHSLEEWNALLSLYRIRASRGKPGSYMYQRRGLVYQVLARDGRPQGIPLKASLLTGKPVLNRLEGIFSEALSRTCPPTSRIHAQVNWQTAKFTGDWSQWREALERAGISTVLVPSGHSSSLFFIDHQCGLVASAQTILGEGYGLEAILEKLGLGGKTGESERLRGQKEILPEKNTGLIANGSLGLRKNRGLRL
jgi:hypothetical protein